MALAWRWHLDPAASGVVLLALACYGWLHGRDAGQGGGAAWRPWRVVCFVLGCAVTLLALESPLEAWADGYFWAHMLQHMLLLIVSPPLLVLGIPAPAMLRALPRDWRRRFVRPLARNRALHRLTGFLVHPFTVFLVFNGTLALWHLPAIFRAAASNPTLHVPEHAMYLGAGLLLWWTIAEPLRVWPRGADLRKIVFVVVCHLPMVLLGQVFLAFAARPLYAAGDPVGLAATADQQLGGAIMVGLDMVIIFATVSGIFGRYLARLEREGRAREQRLP